MTKRELLDVLQEFYTLENQKQYGVLGIRIEKIIYKLSLSLIYDVIDGKASCDNAKAIAEETIEKCFITMCQKLSYNNEKIIAAFLKRVEESINECEFDRVLKI